MGVAWRREQVSTSEPRGRRVLDQENRAGGDECFDDC